MSLHKRSRSCLAGNYDDIRVSNISKQVLPAESVKERLLQALVIEDPLPVIDDLVSESFTKLINFHNSNTVAFQNQVQQPENIPQVVNNLNKKRITSTNEQQQQPVEPIQEGKRMKTEQNSIAPIKVEIIDTSQVINQEQISSEENELIGSEFTEYDVENQPSLIASLEEVPASVKNISMKEIDLFAQKISFIGKVEKLQKPAGRIKEKKKKKLTAQERKRDKFVISSPKHKIVFGMDLTKTHELKQHVDKAVEEHLKNKAENQQPKSRQQIKLEVIQQQQKEKAENEYDDEDAEVDGDDEYDQEDEGEVSDDSEDSDKAYELLEERIFKQIQAQTLKNEQNEILQASFRESKEEQRIKAIQAEAELLESRFGDTKRRQRGKRQSEIAAQQEAKEFVKHIEFAMNELSLEQDAKLANILYTEELGPANLTEEKKQQLNDQLSKTLKSVDKITDPLVKGKFREYYRERFEVACTRGITQIVFDSQFYLLSETLYDSYVWETLILNDSDIATLKEKLQLKKIRELTSKEVKNLQARTIEPFPSPAQSTNLPNVIPRHVLPDDDLTHSIFCHGLSTYRNWWCRQELDKRKVIDSDHYIIDNTQALGARYFIEWILGYDTHICEKIRNKNTQDGRDKTTTMSTFEITNTFYSYFIDPYTCDFAYQPHLEHPDYNAQYPSCQKAWQKMKPLLQEALRQHMQYIQNLVSNHFQVMDFYSYVFYNYSIQRAPTTLIVPWMQTEQFLCLPYNQHEVQDQKNRLPNKSRKFTDLNAQLETKYGDKSTFDKEMIIEDELDNIPVRTREEALTEKEILAMLAIVGSTRVRTKAFAQIDLTPTGVTNLITLKQDKNITLSYQHLIKLVRQMFIFSQRQETVIGFGSDDYNTVSHEVRGEDQGINRQVSAWYNLLNNLLDKANLHIAIRFFAPLHKVFKIINSKRFTLPNLPKLIVNFAHSVWQRLLQPVTIWNLLYFALTGLIHKSLTRRQANYVFLKDIFGKPLNEKTVNANELCALLIACIDHFPKTFVYLQDRLNLHSVFIIILPLIFRYCYSSSLDNKKDKNKAIRYTVQCSDLSIKLDKSFFTGEKFGQYVEYLRSTHGWTRILNQEAVTEQLIQKIGTEEQMVKVKQEELSSKTKAAITLTQLPNFSATQIEKLGKLGSLPNDEMVRLDQFMADVGCRIGRYDKALEGQDEAMSGVPLTQEQISGGVTRMMVPVEDVKLLLEEKNDLILKLQHEIQRLKK